MEEPLVNQTFEMRRMEGKGGWTYVEIDELLPEAKGRFGWHVVKGTIDGYEIQQFKVWHTRQDTWFFPVKAQIRKKIRKEVGDSVHLILYPDLSPVTIPDEFLMCLEESPQANIFFNAMSEFSKKHYVDWIYESKTIETRVNRMALAIQKLERGLKAYQNLE
jgi:Domain of unknown function (DUF1905)/Bacteriocin-protection, YdeI or OmpD-Associated